MILRVLLATAAAATVALGGAAHASACGNNSVGESYAAGAGAPTDVYGVSARIAQVGNLDVLTGHVAAWVGVEGPNEWLQVGYAGFPSITGSDIYYEVALPGQFPTYHQVAAGVPVGTYSKVTVLEMRGRASWWRVWVDHKPASPPIHLPHSTDRLLPVVTAESWDAGTGSSCSASPFRFRNVSIARAPGGDWQRLSSERLGATS